MKILFLSAVLCLFVHICKGQLSQGSRVFEPVNFSRVKVTDSFWKPKMDKVATTTLDACIDQTEVKTARIRNFEKVARGKGEKHEGIYYDDSDVFKALEAIANALSYHKDVGLEKRADEWIDKIAAAQQPDGYLNTYYTLEKPDARWSDMSMHEDYNDGHLIEAGVAYYHTTGKRKLLDVAIRWANHFDSLFGPGKRHWVTGHQELELALVKLYQTTGNKKYLDLSYWLLEERGHGYAKGFTWSEWKDTGFAQDLQPLRLQKEITGHAVRAMYLYTGAADVASLKGDPGYMKAMRSVWEDVVYRNMYITGGIGSSGRNEGFTNDYDLPNGNAYCETCASVGMVFWNQRMAALTGNAIYYDVLERSLYNGALDGISLSGDRFFYGNPLASDGQHSRKEWFGTACCPSNIARLSASLGNYIYAESKDGIWINLFVGSEASLKVGRNVVDLVVRTAYPLNGRLDITVKAKRKSSFALRIRLPGWARGEAVPGGLYQFDAPSVTKATVMVNNKLVEPVIENGYLVISRVWDKDDKVLIDLPMQVEKIVTSRVPADSGRIALQYGPLVYCVEGIDNGGSAWNILLPAQAQLRVEQMTIVGERINAIKGELPVVTVGSEGGSVSVVKKTVTAIPYYVWCNRGPGEMQVWLPTQIDKIKVNP